MKELWTDSVRKIKERLAGISSLRDALAAASGYLQPILILVAITLLSFLVVDIFYTTVRLQGVSRPAVAKSGSAAASSRTQAQPAEHYQIIAERNLFLTTMKAIADKYAAGGSLPSEEYTAFDLKGTIAVDQSIGYAIVEEKGKGRQKLYRIGDMIGSARLIRVTRNTAILASGGRELVMKIKDIVEGSLTGRPSPPKSSVSISKQEVTESLGDLKSIMSQAVVRPFINEGVQQGFVISNIVPGSLYERLGLKNGDVIIDVNNRKLETADDLLQLVGVMQAGGGISVNLMRNGQTETVQYSFH